MQRHKLQVDKKCSSEPPSFEENFKIFLRVKPASNTHSSSLALRIASNRSVQVVPPYYSTEPERIYQYEEVFGQKATNLEVFQRTMREPIRNVLSGFNSTVFIYGMTGAGKTYTMFSSEPEGLVGLTLERLFEQLKNQEGHSQVLLSFFQIYNENIRDLLSESHRPLSIMEDQARGVFINELRELHVKDAPSAKTAILESLARRSNNATSNNEYSSRSHAILQFTLKRWHPGEGEQVGVTESKLFLIDLAGNQKAGQNENKRFVEGVNINKSLLTLGKCITILAEQSRPTFIPFRDSKLTRILKDSLGGNSKTVMIACVSPEARFYEVTLNTLKYSTKARRIKNRGKAASIKMVDRRDLPQPFSEPEGLEEKLIILVNRLQALLEQKLRVEQMRQEMHECYQESQNENTQSTPETVKEMAELIPKLTQKYSQIETIIEQEIKKFIVQTNKHKQAVNNKHQLNSCKLKLKDQAKEIHQLKSIIAEQNAKMQALSKINSQEYSKHFPEDIFNFHYSNNEPQVNQPPQTPNALKIGTPTVLEKVHNSHILIHQSTGRSEEKMKERPNIEIATTKNSNKENVSFLNDLKRSNTPQSSLHSSKILKDSNRTKQAAKPTINITVDNIKLKSPTARIEFKGPHTEYAVNQRESFMQRLQEIDKNMHRLSRQQLRAMVEEFEQGGFEVNKMQASMVNKLKFMAKASDKSLPKDKPKKDRSLLK